VHFLFEMRSACFPKDLQPAQYGPLSQDPGSAEVLGVCRSSAPAFFGPGGDAPGKRNGQWWLELWIFYCMDAHGRTRQSPLQPRKDGKRRGEDKLIATGERPAGGTIEDRAACHGCAGRPGSTMFAFPLLTTLFLGFLVPRTVGRSLRAEKPLLRDSVQHRWRQRIRFLPQ